MRTTKFNTGDSFELNTSIKEILSSVFKNDAQQLNTYNNLFGKSSIA